MMADGLTFGFGPLGIECIRMHTLRSMIGQSPTRIPPKRYEYMFTMGIHEHCYDI